MGQLEAFLPPRLHGRCRIGQETFADAPRVTASRRKRSSWVQRSARGSAHNSRTPNSIPKQCKTLRLFLAAILAQPVRRWPSHPHKEIVATSEISRNFRLV